MHLRYSCWQQDAPLQGDTSIPISLLRDVADALLERPGAKVCDPVTQRPIVGLSTEYCSTVYVASHRRGSTVEPCESRLVTLGSCAPQQLDSRNRARPPQCSPEPPQWLRE